MTDGRDVESLNWFRQYAMVICYCVLEPKLVSELEELGKLAVEGSAKEPTAESGSSAVFGVRTVNKIILFTSYKTYVTHEIIIMQLFEASPCIF